MHLQGAHGMHSAHSGGTALRHVVCTALEHALQPRRAWAGLPAPQGMMMGAAHVPDRAGP